MLDESGIKCASVTPRSILVEYGPIRVRHRRSSSQTMATGRRTKTEVTSAEDSVKREARRERNRLAARELKKTRDNIESELMRQVDELEEERARLEEQQRVLEDQKARLNRAIYNAKQAPLVPLIANIGVPVMFAVNQQQDVLVDLRSLINDMDASEMSTDE